MKLRRVDACQARWLARGDCAEIKGVLKRGHFPSPYAGRVQNVAATDRSVDVEFVSGFVVRTSLSEVADILGLGAACRIERRRREHLR